MTDLLTPAEEAAARLSPLPRPPFRVIIDATDYERMTTEGALVRAALARREALRLGRRGVDGPWMEVTAWYWVRELEARTLRDLEIHPQSMLVSWAPGLHAGRRVIPGRPVLWAAVPLSPDLLVPDGLSPEAVAGFIARGEEDLSLTHVLANARSQHLLRPRSSP